MLTVFHLLFAISYKSQESRIKTWFKSQESRIKTWFKSQESRINTSYKSQESRIKTSYKSQESRIKTSYKSQESRIKTSYKSQEWRIKKSGVRRKILWVNGNYRRIYLFYLILDLQAVIIVSICLGFQYWWDASSFSANIVADSKFYVDTDIDTQ